MLYYRYGTYPDEYKWINEETGEVCKSVIEIFESITCDIKYFGFEALTWIFMWRKNRYRGR